MGWVAPSEAPRGSRVRGGKQGKTLIDLQYTWVPAEWFLRVLSFDVSVGRKSERGSSRTNEPPMTGTALKPKPAPSVHTMPVTTESDINSCRNFVAQVEPRNWPTSENAALRCSASRCGN